MNMVKSPHLFKFLQFPKAIFVMFSVQVLQLSQIHH